MRMSDGLVLGRLLSPSCFAQNIPWKGDKKESIPTAIEQLKSLFAGDRQHERLANINMAIIKETIGRNKCRCSR